jgi:hypothetical protein
MLAFVSVATRITVTENSMDVVPMVKRKNASRIVLELLLPGVRFSRKLLRLLPQPHHNPLQRLNLRSRLPLPLLWHLRKVKVHPISLLFLYHHPLVLDRLLHLLHRRQTPLL